MDQELILIFARTRRIDYGTFSGKPLYGHKKLFYEGILRVSKESYGPFVKKVLLFLAAAWVILAAVILMGSGSLPYVVLEFVVVVVIGAWLTVFIPRSKARRTWTALENRSNGDPERVTRFYSSYLEADNGSEEITVF